MYSQTLTKKKELFCEYVARQGYDPDEAAFAAGYRGGRDKEKRNCYHNMMANRLLAMPDIIMRINEIKDEILAEDKHYQADMVNRLKRVVAFNPLKYYESHNRVTKDESIKTEIYLKTQVQDWAPEDGALVAGFDKNGMPRFIDKQWAIDKLLKIYSLDGSRDVDVEDLMNLFYKVGLPFNQPGSNNYSMKYAELDEDDDIEALEKEIDDSLEEDEKELEVEDSQLIILQEALKKCGGDISNLSLDIIPDIDNIIKEAKKRKEEEGAA